MRNGHRHLFKWLGLCTLLIILGPLSLLHHIEASLDHHHRPDCAVCHLALDAIAPDSISLPLPTIQYPPLIAGAAQHLPGQPTSPTARSPPQPV
ncbi:hypothetical protein [Photobacterium ganghwense]|uniref:hypothetical protein n=1 Tax=Photobacterium ganghwense TaxID=320778 RepID=UPI0039F0E91B